jgi:DNA-binding XRE family transcriptional regulator
MINHFSNNLKVIRKRQSMSQDQVASLTGIKRHKIAAYEEGRSEPNIDTLINLSTSLKISIHDLIVKDLCLTLGNDKNP